MTKVLLRYPWIQAPSRSTKWLPDWHSSSNFNEQPFKTPEGGEKTEGRGEGIPQDGSSFHHRRILGREPSRRNGILRQVCGVNSQISSLLVTTFQCLGGGSSNDWFCVFLSISAASVCLHNQWTWRNPNEQTDAQGGVTREHTWKDRHSFVDEEALEVDSPFAMATRFRKPLEDRRRTYQ